MRVNPIRDVGFRSKWSKRHAFCQSCGISLSEAKKKVGFGLEVHHITRFRRSDEACVLLKLCSRCHGSAGGASMVEKGVRYPVLTFGMCLAIKSIRDPDEFDADRLAELFGRALPEMQVWPEVYEVMYRKWHPEPYRPCRDLDMIVTCIEAGEKSRVEIVKVIDNKPKRQAKSKLMCARCMRLGGTRMKCGNCEALRKAAKL